MRAEVQQLNKIAVSWQGLNWLSHWYTSSRTDRIINIETGLETSLLMNNACCRVLFTWCDENIVAITLMGQHLIINIGLK